MIYCRYFTQKTGVAIAIAASLCAGCTSIPDKNMSLDQARGQFNAAQADSQVMLRAGEELKRADESLRAADKAWADGQPVSKVDHLAYMAIQRVRIAQETAASKTAQEVTANAAAERDRLRLEARTLEANQAKQELALAQQSNAYKTVEVANANASAANANAIANSATASAASANANAANANANAASATADAVNATAAANNAVANAARSDARANDLEMQLADLNAKKTERGLVVTLGDVLFATGKFNLLPASQNNMVKLAAVFKNSPERRASIEGYTDSTGSDNDNYLLSERRANAVMVALINLGVAADRLRMKAHGAQDPIANNNTATGRQMNRRVEVVFLP